jgi:threonine/homoserine/homoserine lactone efflux protein
MSVLLGVIFFLLIQTGIKHHPKKAFTIAAGVITGDIIFIVFAILFTEFIADFLKIHERKASLLGGIVFLIMGLTTFLQSRKNFDDKLDISWSKNARAFYLKPFIINLLNPANAAWWLGLYSIPPAIYYHLNQKIIFALGAVITVYFTEVGVAYAASGLKKYITEKILKRIDWIVAIALIFLAIKLFLNAANIW